MNKQQQQYKITEAYITTDRTADERFDIKSTIVEFVLFENLEKPYITGQVALSDDIGLYDRLGFSGTERFYIRMASEDTSLAPVMDRTFLMTGIDTIVKSSESGTSSVYVFSLMDEHVMLSKSKKISRTVQGNLESQITKIIGSDLKKDVDLSYSSESLQSNFKAIIPYMTPLDACEWLRDRATTSTGLPYFLYASIHDTNLRLGNLEVMLKQGAWNSKVPYLFAPSNVQIAEEQGDVEKNFIVQSMKSTKLQNTFKQLQTGGIGSLYNNTNINNGRISSTHFSVQSLLEEMENKGLIDMKKQNVYDETYQNAEGRSLHELDARIFHTITSSGTYGTFKSYHDELDPAKFRKKIENLAVRNMLYKNMFDITVPGAGFIVSKASVGDIVKINVLSDDNNPKSEQKFDELRSGEFLIYNARHTFKDTRHDVAMTVCKLERG
jgi:hypothetical protein